MAISCPKSGLSATLSFKEGGEVKGSVDAVDPVDPPSSRKSVRIGTLSGNWRNKVQVSCPGMVRLRKNLKQ